MTGFRDCAVSTVPLPHSCNFSRDLRSSAAASSRREGGPAPHGPAAPDRAPPVRPALRDRQHSSRGGRHRRTNTPWAVGPAKHTARRAPSPRQTEPSAAAQAGPSSLTGAAERMRRARIPELSRAATSPASRPCLRGQRRCRGGAGRARAAAPPVSPRTRAAGRARLPRRRRGAPRTKMAAPRASAAHVSAAPHKDGGAGRASRPRPAASSGNCPEQRWLARSPDAAGFPHVVGAPPAR